MIISFCGSKGGSGKSTLAICLAAELFRATKRASVLLVDADKQGTAATWRAVAHEAGRATPTVITMTGKLSDPAQVPTVSKAYQHTVIDTPGRQDIELRAALMVSDVVLIPCSAAAAETWALAETVESVEAAKILRPKLRVFLAINKQRVGVRAAAAVRETLEKLTLPILETEVGYRQAFQDAIAHGMGVTEYEPKGAAAAEVRALFKEVVL
jgi:chromosome partitioning protein